MLKGACIFCGKSRKKRNGKEELMLKVATIAGCQSLHERAKFSKNERNKSLVRSGVDLIAKKAEYHKSCRQKFLKETDIRDKPAEETSSKSCHKTAFASLLSFVEDEVLTKQRSILVTYLGCTRKSTAASEKVDHSRIYQPTQLRILQEN